MKNILIILGVLIVLVAGLLYFFKDAYLPHSSIPVQPANTNPGGDTDITTNSSTPSTNTLPVASVGGGTILVKDFKKDISTVTTSNIPGYYYLAGGIDSPNNNPPYQTFYTDSDKSFTVSLLQEPLGVNRQKAEQELMQKLGISQADMCRLNYWVGIPDNVNSTYSGKNVGFSFCPGATPLQ